MSGTIYLIGGGELRNGDTLLIDEDILSRVPTGSTLVFFGFAAGDNPDYANAITSVYGGKFAVIIPTIAKGRDYAIKSIDSAAVIYIGGGNTDELLRVFSDWGLAKYIQSAIGCGTHVAGMSAGALALCSWYVHEEQDLLKIKKGSGVVPKCLQVHANQYTYEKARALWAKTEGANKYPFVAVGEKAALCINASVDQKLGNGEIWEISDGK